MQRAIKFRGKRRDTGEWGYGDLLQRDGKVYVGERGVDPESVGQYTGLHDKNGVEICEGDVVKVDNWDEYQRILWHKWGAWHMSRHEHEGGAYELGFYNPHISMEVIGNVYDSPELVAKS